MNTLVLYKGRLSLQPFWQTQEIKSHFDQLLSIPDKVEQVDPAELRGGVTDRESWTDVAWEDILGESTGEEQETGLECTRGQAQKREVTWEEEENTADWELLEITTEEALSHIRASTVD